MGGNVVLVLGPKWRLHYYAHLEQYHDRNVFICNKKFKNRDVGTTGNAVGKPPHFHYAITTALPYLAN